MRLEFHVHFEFFSQVKKTQSEQLYLYQKKKKLEERLAKLKSNVANKKQQYTHLAISSKENSTYLAHVHLIQCTIDYL